MFGLRLIVVFVLSMSSVALSATLDKKIDFLLMYKNYYELAQEINLKHLSNYITCLRDENSKFRFQYIDQQGEVVTRPVSCEEAMPVVFENRLESEYLKMRISLALSRPGRVNEKYIMSMSNNLNYKINIDIDHPNDTSMTTLPFDIEKPAPLSQREIKQAMRTYNRHKRKNCEVYANTVLRHELESHVLIKRLGSQALTEIQKNFCGDLDIKKYSSNIFYSFKDVLRNYHRWLESKRHDFRKKNLNVYYSLVNQSPYFLLLKNSNPSNEELLRALETIYDNAIQKKQEFKEYSYDYNISERISEYHSGYLSESQKHDLFEDLSHYVNDPLFIKFYDAFSKKLSEDTKTEINEVISSNDLKNTLKEVGIILGGMASCFIPSQKLFKLLKFVKPLKSAKILKLSCLTALGIPLNSWFIYDSISRYEDGLQELLSSADGRYVIRKYDSINRTDLLLNTLFFASGAGAAKLLIKAIKAP